ncbi:N-6 DNA methylase [Deinococcus yunweiensis]|uniref:N-6 DNA methylase n=1 Tax=Deinococcus yunweiensis TaxID=367282 RepID=UPI00398E36E6
MSDPDRANTVDCIGGKPGPLFYTTQIPVSLWILANNKQSGTGQEACPLRDRSGQVPFFDARDLGYMRTRTERNLTDEDRSGIIQAYHTWRGDGDGEYTDVPGVCRADTIDNLEKNGWVLTPGQCVGAAPKEDSKPFVEKMTRLSGELRAQFAESDRLQAVIQANFERLGSGE